MILEEGSIPTIEPGDDFSACAEIIASGRGAEFAFFPYIDADVVEAATVARFMPMGYSFNLPRGRRDVLLAKLHFERCLFDPALVRITKTARRESRKYALSFNRSFDAVLASCVAKHGPDWLVADLVDAYSTLHAERARRKAAFVSVELWRVGGDAPELVAGEIGYLVGSAYASLTGYTDVSGAGTVQLAALGRALARSGISVWDLGMKIDYKTDLGALALPRSEFMPILAGAYADAPARASLDALTESGFLSARDLMESGTAPVACSLAPMG